VSWKGERGVGWPAGGVGGHCELERGERIGVALWRGWQSSKDLNGEGDTFLHEIGSLSERFGV
jgi:hypothetical protein